MKGKIEKLGKMLSEGKISAVELTEMYLKRIDDDNKKINAFITVCGDYAKENAKRADELFGSKRAGKLTGIPMSLKDNLSTKGVLTTAGSKMLSRYVPFYDAFAYECLKNEGVVMLGKNNMDEFSMGSSNDTSYYGDVLNPLDEKRSPGGSSGGSAAAVASGMAVYSLASDTGGSIRLPASYTGTVGLCPTYGTLSRRGLIAHSSLLDRVGVIASMVSDVAMVFDAINRHDGKDMTSSCTNRKSVTEGIEKGIKGMKIGIVTDVFDKAHEETKRLFVKASETFKMLGAEVSETMIHHWEKADSVYSIISTSDAASNLTRYDSVRFGGAEGDSIIESREGFGDEARMRILLGNAVLTSEEKLHLRKKAESERVLIKEAFEKAFTDIDILITPTAYHTAPLKDDAKEKLTDYFLTAPSVAHIPSVSVPMGFSENGMPLGLQIIGKAFTEDVILRAAYAFEEAKKNEIYKKGGEAFGF